MGKDRDRILPLTIIFGFIFVCWHFLSYTDNKRDFYELMGQKQEVWKLILKQDLPLLEQFYQLEQSSQQKNSFSKIPETIHFIWVGPKEFPKESVKNVYSWIEKHPEFQVYFWTDRERNLPHPLMKVRYVQDFDWHYLKKQFLESDNYAEQSDLLRYEILYQEGGVYVDHDVECFQSLKDLIQSCDLFCGLEPPHKPVAQVSVTVCNNLIGSCTLHPILKTTIDNVLEKWDRYKVIYQGSDVNSITKRVYYRTFSSFDDAVKKLMSDSVYKTRVFPAGYFNKIGKKFGLYTNHLYASSWFEHESSFEKNVRQRLVKICKKNNQILLIVAVFFALVCILVFSLSLQLHSLKKQFDLLQKKKE